MVFKSHIHSRSSLINWGIIANSAEWDYCILYLFLLSLFSFETEQPRKASRCGPIFCSCKFYYWGRDQHWKGICCITLPFTGTVVLLSKNFHFYPRKKAVLFGNPSMVHVCSRIVSIFQNFYMGVTVLTWNLAWAENVYVNKNHPKTWNIIPNFLRDIPKQSANSPKF